MIIIPKLIRVVLLLSGSNNKSLPHVGSSTLLIVLSTIMIFSINVFIYNNMYGLGPSVSDWETWATTTWALWNARNTYMHEVT